jgi:hypothetical protein
MIFLELKGNEYLMGNLTSNQEFMQKETKKLNLKYFNEAKKQQKLTK